jgi:putative CocE/NonD family hydrolase
MSGGEANEVRILRNVAVPLRDGVRTAAEVWIPDDGRAHPAILARTPYGKEGAAPTAVIDVRLATARGYAVVLQDVRGRFASEGVFEPFVHEQADGADSVAWVADQAWCDGNVVMAGASYMGATQWLAAADAPAALRAIAPTISSDEFAEGWSYRAGVPEHAFLTTWNAADLALEADRMLDDPERAWDDVATVEAIAPWLRDWLAHAPGSDYWRARSVADRREQVRVPVLVVAGWYDVFLSASLRSFARSRDPRDRLVLGPWGHDDTLSNLVGAANVGVAGLGMGRLFGWVLDFYDAILAKREPELPRVRAYVLGARRWVDLDAWPPPGADRLTAPLDGGAFTVDPAAPVPTYGGRGLQVQVPGWGRGIADQRPLLGRADVHVAARLTLARDTLLAGPIAAVLATAADGDGDGDRLWVATLCAEQADGALHNLAESVAAAPPAAARVDVDLGDTFARLPAGSTLVLLVAGSSFPRWPKPLVAGSQRVLPGSQLELTITPPDLLEPRPSP